MAPKRREVRNDRIIAGLATIVYLALGLSIPYIAIRRGLNPTAPDFNVPVRSDFSQSVRSTADPANL